VSSAYKYNGRYKAYKKKYQKENLNHGKGHSNRRGNANNPPKQEKPLYCDNTRGDELCERSADIATGKCFECGQVLGLTTEIEETNTGIL